MHVREVPCVWVIKLAVFGAVVEHASRERRGATDCRLPRVPVGHDAREVNYVGDPAAVLLALDLDAIESVRRLVSKASGTYTVSSYLDRVVARLPDLIWLVTFDPEQPNNGLKVGVFCPGGESLK